MCQHVIQGKLEEGGLKITYVGLNIRQFIEEII